MKPAQIVKKIRISYLMEQKEFGLMIGKSTQAIYAYEKGVRKPRMEAIKKLIKLAKKKNIRVNIEDFFL